MRRNCTACWCSVHIGEPRDYRMIVRIHNISPLSQLSLPAHNGVPQVPRAAWDLQCEVEETKL